MTNLISIRDETIERVNARKAVGGGLNHIAAMLGDKKRHQSWLSRFSCGKIKNPGIETLDALIRVLNTLDSVPQGAEEGKTEV